MTKKIFFCALVVVLSLQTLLSQKDTLKNSSRFFAVKTDLLYLSFNAFGVVNTAALTLEKGFRSKHSFQLTGKYLNDLQFSDYIWQVIPEYKYYTNTRKNFKGLYIGVYFKYEKETYVEPSLYWGRNTINSNLTDNYKRVGGGFTVGYQLYIWKHLTLDALAGLGTKYVTRVVTGQGNRSIASNSVVDDYPRINPDGRFMFNLGYKF